MAVSGVDTTFEEGTTTHKDRFMFKSNFSEIPQPVPTDNPDPTIVYPVSPGNGIDVAAPAVEIPTTSDVRDEDGIARSYIYTGVTGTSLAAPHVAGLVGLYILANGRAYDEKGVYRIRQAIIDASQPQSSWASSPDTGDPDSHPEPMAVASEAWVPKPILTNAGGGPGNFQFSFNTIPGYDYLVQSATNLTPPVAWTNLVTLGTSANSNVLTATVTDTNAAGQSVYRVERTASP
jgi:subtilisin family serine protease